MLIIDGEASCNIWSVVFLQVIVLVCVCVSILKLISPYVVDVPDALSLC